MSPRPFEQNEKYQQWGYVAMCGGRAVKGLLFTGEPGRRRDAIRDVSPVARYRYPMRRTDDRTRHQRGASRLYYASLREARRC